ncbi:MAG TPA: cytochrome P450 [Solirubrobacteraceae bacterium]|nr:cytochrome P450 [Solirubrobacteraceae bacterium]
MRNTSELPPGPRMPSAAQTLGFWSRPTAFLERARKRYGRRFTIRLLGSPPFVIISDPDEIKQLFQAPPEVLHPGEGARILEPVLGRHSVILLDEDPHLEQRKLMLPAFHGERMAQLSGLMDELARSEVASWPRDQELALHARLQGLTLEIILRAVFGLERGAQLDQLRELLTRLLAFAESPLSLLPPLPPALDRRWPISRVTPTAGLARVDRLIFELIDERRRSGGGGEDVLAMLLQAEHADGSPMSNQELRDELLTALVAGHETTASQLAWAFERLSREPAVLARLQAELDDGEDEAYLTATINEIMRHRPVLPNPEPRLVKQPIQIGDLVYPRGIALVASAYLLHHDPTIYPDPYAFSPDRFLERAPGTYTWIPFGGGRRRCLGANFALLEMKLVLRAVLESCELHSVGGPPEATRRRSITISPARGSRVVLRDRRPAADARPDRAAALAA